jgi:uncharacterized protein (DUF433 family)
MGVNGIPHTTRPSRAPSGAERATRGTIRPVSDGRDILTGVDNDAKVLDLPLYSVTEAGRLLGVLPATLKRWLEGYEARGAKHLSIIRPEPTGEDSVTWGEFVEAGFLHEYRTRLPLQRIRPLVDAMRQEFDVRYPLAHFQPLVDPKKQETLFELQSVTRTPEALYLVRWRDQQLMWAEPLKKFFEKVEFDPYAVARRVFPLGRHVPVSIDPEKSFGVPQVRGVRTEAIVELIDAGESRESVARMWGLDEEEVEAAQTWERHLKKAA